MYKQLKKQIDDKKILEDLEYCLKERIKLIIQKQLGLHATSYAELKIECPTVDDKYAKVFGKVEELDKDLQRIKEEIKIIEDTLNKIDKKIATMNDTEKKVFRCRFLWGMTVKQTAERLNYGTDRIKQITREIFKK